MLMLLCCVGVAALALTAPRRPRFAQLAFLIVAAFILTNKVYSPQYVLWLVPLAALARPKWRDFLVWQGACEVAYFLASGCTSPTRPAGDAHKGLPVDGYHWRSECICWGRSPVRHGPARHPDAGAGPGAPVR
ncbi:hypothetical protein GCM10023238_19320 [Streptomyces heliomycini]